MGLTKEQQEELKKKVMADICRPLNLDGLDVDVSVSHLLFSHSAYRHFFFKGLRNKIKELHHRLSRLESDRYDLEKRAERQTYDVGEFQFHYEHYFIHLRFNLNLVERIERTTASD